MNCDLSRRAVLGGVAAWWALADRALAQTPELYAGKTITVICGYNPGGGVDLGTRLIADNIGRHIAGSPKLIVQNMEGAAGLIAANHLYAKGSSDGLTLAVPGRDWILKPFLGFPNARFDPLKFHYIGSTGATNVVGYVNAAAGIQSAADLKNASRKIRIGGLPGTSVNTAVPTLLAQLGWPIQVIKGYANTPAIILAMEQGELDGIYTPDSSFARRRDLIESKKVLPLFQSSPGGDVPELRSLVAEQDRGLMDLAHGQIIIGMPLVAPPGTPADRVEVLRAAFMAMATDPEFEKHARRIDEPLGAPLSGATLQEAVARMIKTITPATVEAYSKL
jgi:tripartite-type tricarboxylate transporter receptor subunit TctC